MQKRSWIILILVVLTAAIFRTIFITTFPPSLNWDEVSLGYNAYSVFKTGKDEWGIVLPTIFRAFGDFKLPGYVYADVPFVSVLGLNQITVKAPSILAGIGLTLLAFLLSKKLFLDDRIALLTAFFVAIEPWNVFLSRIAVEANLATLFCVLGLTLLVYRKSFMGIIFLVLSAWTYNSFRLFIPLMFLWVIIFYRRHLKITLIHVLLFAILFIPIALQLASLSGQARFDQLTILDSGAIARIENLRTTTTLPFARFIYNRPLYFISQFSVQYLGHFLPLFLFIDGGSHYQFNIPHMGLLLLSELPLFYLGLAYVIKNRKLPSNQFILAWLILSPIPGSITRDSPHTLRAVDMLPIPMLLPALGLIKFAEKVKVKYLVYLIFIILFVSSGLFYLNSSLTYRVDYSWAWQYGNQQMVQYVKENMSQFGHVIITKRYAEPHEFFAFYLPINPAAFQQNKQWDYHANWYWVNSYDQLIFVNDWEMPKYVKNLLPGERYLIVASPDNPTEGFTLKTINFLDGKPAYIIKSK